MGSSEGGLGEGGLAMVDCSVGTIVWVRRRNGSWWPGRILGQHELSASHLMSPRSGTPVKLLGREDASVDWYNLEKSKRVKAFRCGEFDACIERAEAALGGPIRKREKYARREDAILHALELEKRQVQPLHPNSGLVSNAASAMNVAPLTILPPLDPSLKLPSSRVPPEEASGINRAGAVGPTLDESSRSAQALSNPNNARGVGGSGKSSGLAKRKRSHGGLLEESLGKRRDRRRPLVQVLKSSAKLAVALPQPSSDSGCQLASNVDHQSLFLPEDPDEVLISYGANGLHVPGSPSLDGGVSSLPFGDDEDVSSEGEAEDLLLQDESFLDDEDVPGKMGGSGGRSHEPSVSGRRRHPLSNDEGEGDGGGADLGVSKWHLKGKRNIRPTHMLKRGVLGEEEPPNGSSYYQKKKGSDGSGSRFFHGSGDEDELSPGRSLGWSCSFWGADPDDEELADLRHGRGHGGGADWQAALVEVELKVQASYQGERVPLVSLMSRLNGKAIIGHPVPVEILIDGAAADLLVPIATAAEPLGSSADVSPSSAAPPVWRTGRRTAMQRVPRSQLGPSADDDDGPSYTDGPAAIGSTAARKKAAAKARKKLQKKGMASLSSQKTRTLSSIVTERRRSSKGAASRLGGGGGILGGLMKHGGSAVPPVTCVPIKVVFSRIMEAVGRLPSTAAARRTAPVDRRPSSPSSPSSPPL
ncbi:tudor/PWWP/MBT superfamily protein [Wolffia australiana]